MNNIREDEKDAIIRYSITAMEQLRNASDVIQNIYDESIVDRERRWCLSLASSNVQICLIKVRMSMKTFLGGKDLLSDLHALEEMMQFLESRQNIRNQIMMEKDMQICESLLTSLRNLVVSTAIMVDDAKTGADELKVLGNKLTIRINLRHLFMKLDEDANNFIAGCIKEKDQISLLLVCKLIVEIFFACGISYGTVFIPFLFYGIGILPFKVAKVIASISPLTSGFIILYPRLTKLFKIIERRYTPKAPIIPNWFLLYLKARKKFPNITPAVTSLSHPHLFRFLGCYDSSSLEGSLMSVIEKYI